MQLTRHYTSSCTYAKLFFVNFSSAFHAIIPALLQDRRSQLNVPSPTCSLITDFLSEKHVRLGRHFSDSQNISTGSAQGCVLLSSAFLPVYRDICTSSHQSLKLLKFASGITLIRLISRALHGEDCQPGDLVQRLQPGAQCYQNSGLCDTVSYSAS